MSHIPESEKIYYSCLNKNKDGSKRLFEKGEQCCTATNSPFWKRPWNVTSGVRTRSQKKNKKKLTLKNLILSKFMEYSMVVGGK